jgi:hypothetical protein
LLHETIMDVAINVLALDPGKTTGYALLTGRTGLQGHLHLELGEFETWTRLHTLIVSDTEVVYEKPFLDRFTDPIVFEVKGAILCVAQHAQAALMEQAPSVPHFIWARHKLQGKLVGSQHPKDAFCHLLHYAVRKKFLDAGDVIALLATCSKLA